MLDTESGPSSDLTGYTFKSQIRARHATRSVKTGDWENALVIEVAIEANGSVLSQSLTRVQTSGLPLGDYLIDIVGTKDALDEAFLEPEVIRVMDAPTFP